MGSIYVQGETILVAEGPTRTEKAGLGAVVAELGRVKQVLPLPARLGRHPTQIPHRRGRIGNAEKLVLGRGLDAFEGAALGDNGRS